MGKSVFNKVNNHTIEVYDNYVCDMLNRLEQTDNACKHNGATLNSVLFQCLWECQEKCVSRLIRVL